MWFQVLMVNSDHEKDRIEVEAVNNHQAILIGEEEYDRKGWHGLQAKRIYNETCSQECT